MISKFSPEKGFENKKETDPFHEEESFHQHLVSSSTGFRPARVKVMQERRLFDEEDDSLNSVAEDYFSHSSENEVISPETLDQLLLLFYMQPNVLKEVMKEQGYSEAVEKMDSTPSP